MDGRHITLSAPAGGAIAREWARDWITRAAAVLLLVPFSVALASANLPLAAKLTAGIVLFVTLARPAWGIVTAAALVPAVALLQRPTHGAIDLATFVACAIAPAALLRLGANTDRGARWPAVLGLGAVIALSYFKAVTPPVVTWLEGLALAVVAARLVRRHREAGVVAARAVMIGSAVVAAASLVEVIRVEDLLRTRISPVFADPNAAGSYFAAAGVASLWLVLTGEHRWRWRFVALLSWLALWLTGSRTAMGSAVLMFVLAWAVNRRPRPAVWLVTVAGVAVALTYLAFAPPSRQPQAAAGYAAHVRFEMARVAITIARDHPILGVGLGNFQSASRAYIPPDLVALFPPAAAGENAHNNFLQILAELGVPGLVGFIAVLVAPLHSGWRAFRRREEPREGVALWIGLTAFLVTCLAGHPLLTPPILLAFLLTLGLAHGLTSAGHEELV